jgi:hypothetical protein
VRLRQIPGAHEKLVGHLAAGEAERPLEQRDRVGARQRMARIDERCIVADRETVLAIVIRDRATGGRARRGSTTRDGLLAARSDEINARWS